MKSSFFFLLVGAFTWIGCQQSSSRTELLPGETRLDRPVPEFHEPTLAGDSLASANFKGQITVVNFWATWCGPCVVEIPEFVALQEEWKDRPFQFVGVSMDDAGFESIATFVSDFQMNYPQIMDTGELADSFGGVWALPTTFVVDQNGIVLASYLGLFPLSTLRDELDEMVKAIESGETSASD